MGLFDMRAKKAHEANELAKLKAEIAELKKIALDATDGVVKDKTKEAAKKAVSKKSKK